VGKSVLDVGSLERTGLVAELEGEVEDHAETSSAEGLLSVLCPSRSHSRDPWTRDRRTG
jgi:hypothetical protein